MKQILRTLAIGSLVITSAVVATVGYFTSNVTAPGNLITTGTLRAAIDSTNTTTNPTTILPNGAGYVVAYDLNGVTTLGTRLPDITGMLPGNTRSVWFSIRNIGTTTFDYRANFSGTWGNPTLDGENAVTVTQIHRYQNDFCASVVGCENIYYWLTNGYGYTNVGNVADLGGLTGAVSPTGTAYFGNAGGATDGVNVLAANQFTLFRVDFKLDELVADNDYQGKTLTYNLNLQTKQTTAPSFAP